MIVENISHPIILSQQNPLNIPVMWQIQYEPFGRCWGSFCNFSVIRIFNKKGDAFIMITSFTLHYPYHYSIICAILSKIISYFPVIFQLLSLSFYLINCCSFVLQRLSRFRKALRLCGNGNVICLRPLWHGNSCAACPKHPWSNKSSLQFQFHFF